MHFKEHPNVFSINEFVQQNCESFCDATDDVTHYVDVPLRKRLRIHLVISLAFTS